MEKWPKSIKQKKKTKNRTCKKPLLLSESCVTVSPDNVWFVVVSFLFLTEY
jgi:hypothetical protein